MCFGLNFTFDGYVQELTVLKQYITAFLNFKISLVWCKGGGCFQKSYTK